MQSLRTQIAARKRMLRRLDEGIARQENLKAAGQTNPAHADLLVGLLTKARLETEADLARLERALPADGVE